MFLPPGVSKVCHFYVLINLKREVFQFKLQLP